VVSDQRESSIEVVVEGTVTFATLDVAIRARLVGELALVRIAVRMTFYAGAVAVLKLGIRLMTAGALQLRMHSESRKAERRVVNLRAFERDPRLVASCAIGGGRNGGMGWNVTSDACR
jgi:hypothetical protein